MTIPNFLGIGVSKAGTTWLYELLKTHPEVYVPIYKKELFFFNQNYHRGFEWYYKYFPNQEEAKKYKAIGEITPTYLFDPKCPERIQRFSDSIKIILMLRNPLDRLYSHYFDHMRKFNYKGNFGEFLSTYPEKVSLSIYNRPIQDYLKYFKREQMLILIFEEAVQDVPAAKNALADHLSINPMAFPEESGTHKVHSRFLPRYGFLYTQARRISAALRRLDLDAIPIWVLKLGGRKVFGSRDFLNPQITRQDFLRLKTLFMDDIDDLEILLGRDLQEWKKRIDEEIYQLEQ